MSKRRLRASAGRIGLGLAGLLCAALSFVQPLHAGDGKGMTADGQATPEEEPKNWIEVGIGGTIVNGDRAQFEQEHRLPGDEVYGGITDLHYQRTLGKETELEVNGHALFDINDYNISVKLTQPKLGYLAFGYDEFRTWYDGNGGFLPHHNVFFAPEFREMHIDRGEAWVELGLQIPDWPEIVIHYSHLFRDGQKDSTIWGDTSLTGIANTSGRKLAPAYRDIDETRDVFALDAAKTFGNTDVAIGMRYEHSDTDNRLQLERGAGQLPPKVAAPGAQRFITQRDANDLDMFNGHAITETRLTDTLWFTTAYSYSTVGADLTGSRVIGPDYNSKFGDFPQLQSNDHAILNLAGTSQTDEHVFNSNLFWMPWEYLHVLGGFRYTHEEVDSDSTFLDANTATSPPPTHYTPAIPKSADTSESLNNFSERLELRFTKIKNWLFYLEGEWVEEFGDEREHEVGGTLVNNVPTPADQGTLRKDTNLMGQKYTAGATWYPLAWMNMAAQYYYKIADYDNDFHSELATPSDFPRISGSERNQRLLGQDWDTNDVNVRVTIRPKLPEKLGTVSLVSRYDYMQTGVSGKWAVSPAGPSPTPAPTPPVNATQTIYNEERTGVITRHVFSEAVNWNPCPRFYVLTSFSYTLNQTETPVGKTNLIVTGTTTFDGPSVPNFRNDYWTITSAAGYLLDDKTELRSDYTFYRAADYVNNSRAGMPYGAGQTEHTASASVNRELTKNVRLLVKYTYFTYEDQTSGNRNNYEAHAIYSGLQFRF